MMKYRIHVKTVGAFLPGYFIQRKQWWGWKNLGWSIWYETAKRDLADIIRAEREE